jgi:hypothetical protein
MADSKRERRDHFRGKPRPGRRLEVRYRVLDRGLLSDEQRAFTKNIGVGGAFIVTPDPAPPGACLQIALQMPGTGANGDDGGPRAFEVHGDVMWIVDGQHDEPERDHGMGVRFNGLEVEQLLQLNEFFASLTAVADDEA